MFAPLPSVTVAHLTKSRHPNAQRLAFMCSCQQSALFEATGLVQQPHPAQRCVTQWLHLLNLNKEAFVMVILVCCSAVQCSVEEQSLLGVVHYPGQSLIEIAARDSTARQNVPVVCAYRLQLQRLVTAESVVSLCSFALPMSEVSPAYRENLLFCHASLHVGLVRKH